MAIPYPYVEASWFIGALSLVGAGIGILWRLAR